MSIGLFILLQTYTFAQLTEQTSIDSILNHKIQRDDSGNLLAWYKPQQPGAAYIKVAELASEFIKNAPVYDPLGVEMYYISCCFQGPHMTKNDEFIADDWMHNPACVWAGLVQSLVLDYRVYSGDSSYVDILRNMLLHQINHGTTAENWQWPNVPFASADPFELEYRGASRWMHDGIRGDGLYGIEPDKIGELGYAYLCFYKVTEEEKV